MPIVSANLSPKPWLSPPERWAATWAINRQRTHRTPRVIRLETNYGPVGISLMAAGFVWFFIGWLLAVIGIALLIVSHGREPSLLYLGIVFQIPVFIRCAQGVRVGRRHRGDRPFLK